MAKFMVEMVIEDVEVLSTVTVDGKDYIKELLIYGAKVTRVGNTMNKFVIEKDGFTRTTSPHHTSSDYELVKDLKEEVEYFFEDFGGCKRISDENMNKYLTLGDLREMLKDYPDDALLVGLERNLVQSIEIGYVVEKTKTHHDFTGGFDYNTREFLMKNTDFVYGIVNAEDCQYPEDEERYIESVKETKDLVKNFAITRNQDERIGIKLA